MPRTDDDITSVRAQQDRIPSASWFTASDVAARLRVSVATVHRWCREERVSHVRIGRTVRFTAEQLREIEKAHGGGSVETAGDCGMEVDSPLSDSSPAPVPSVTAPARLLDTMAVAEWLGISREQVWRLWSSGQLSGYRFDRRLRFAAQDVTDFLERHRSQPPSPTLRLVEHRAGDLPAASEYRRV